MIVVESFAERPSVVERRPSLPKQTETDSDLCLFIVQGVLAMVLAWNIKVDMSFNSWVVPQPTSSTVTLLVRLVVSDRFKYHVAVTLVQRCCSPAAIISKRKGMIMALSEVGRLVTSVTQV
ncbi:hypothetical protein L210DRAFT_938858 [Boletus edulis BED1]|uniref:Uncharacterized protein n=1 Tax=Boletus edulis BED1 TaxID=1328754 RepID=A0AAD4GNB5_BOLED|nr:hypothetical protein L210DRAFT_938858 [Boletus edulis BED1]